MENIIYIVLTIVTILNIILVIINLRFVKKTALGLVGMSKFVTNYKADYLTQEGLVIKKTQAFVDEIFERHNFVNRIDGLRIEIREFYKKLERTNKVLDVEMKRVNEIMDYLSIGYQPRVIMVKKNIQKIVKMPKKKS